MNKSEEMSYEEKERVVDELGERWGDNVTRRLELRKQLMDLDQERIEIHNELEDFLGTLPIDEVMRLSRLKELSTHR